MYVCMSQECIHIHAVMLRNVRTCTCTHTIYTSMSHTYYAHVVYIAYSGSSKRALDFISMYMDCTAPIALYVIAQS